MEKSDNLVVVEVSTTQTTTTTSESSTTKDSTGRTESNQTTSTTGKISSSPKVEAAQRNELVNPSSPLSGISSPNVENRDNARVRPTASSKATSEAQNAIKETNLLTNKVTRDVEVAKSRCRTNEKRHKLDLVLADFNSRRTKLMGCISSFTQFINDTTATNSWSLTPTASRRITHELKIEIAKQDLTSFSQNIYATISLPESDPDFAPCLKELENLIMHKDSEIYRLEYPQTPLPISFYKQDVIKYLENALGCLEDEERMNNFKYRNFVTYLQSSIKEMRNFGGVVETSAKGGGGGTGRQVLSRKMMEVAEEMIKEARALMMLINEWQLDNSESKLDRLSVGREGWIAIVVNVNEVLFLLSEL